MAGSAPNEKEEVEEAVEKALREGKTPGIRYPIISRSAPLTTPPPPRELERERGSFLLGKKWRERIALHASTSSPLPVMAGSTAFWKCAREATGSTTRLRSVVRCVSAGTPLPPAALPSLPIHATRSLSEAIVPSVAPRRRWSASESPIPSR